MVHFWVCHWPLCGITSIAEANAGRVGKLSDAQIADLEQWVGMGAPDPRTGAAAAGVGGAGGAAASAVLSAALVAVAAEVSVGRSAGFLLGEGVAWGCTMGRVSLGFTGWACGRGSGVSAGGVTRLTVM